MSTDRDVTRFVRSWLEDGATSLSERVLVDVLAQLPTTPQRRAPWPAWRFPSMSSPFKITLVAAAIGALALVSLDVLPRSTDIFGAPAPSASPSPSPAPLRAGTLSAGTYSVAPFVPPDEWTLCMTPPQPGCVETPDDDAITFTFTVPEGWAGAPFKGIWLADEMNAEPGGAGLSFQRGGSLYSDPCLSTSSPSTTDIAVGPSVDEFVDALADHPLLEVTTPVDVTLDGYAGRYLELRTPADISGCDDYYPWEPGLFSQPGRVWHLWILDVDGVRVVVTGTDYPGTAPEARAELEGIVDSIRIHVAPTPAASPSPASVAWSPESMEQDWPAPVRAEPIGDPIVVEWTGTYTDPRGDIESTHVPWIDILRVRGSVVVDLGAGAPSGLVVPSEPRIAYGLVFDTDLDGVADVRLGMDRVPAELTPWGGTPGDTDVRAWRTDLRTGTTEHGHAGNTVCDCLYPDRDGGRGTAHIYPHGELPDGSFGGSPHIPGRFYAWASMIEDGQIVATDYAPDSGWLDVGS